MCPNLNEPCSNNFCKCYLLSRGLGSYTCVCPYGSSKYCPSLAIHERHDVFWPEKSCCPIIGYVVCPTRQPSSYKWISVRIAVIRFTYLDSRLSIHKHPNITISYVLADHVLSLFKMAQYFSGE